MDNSSTPLPSFVELMATLGLDSKQSGHQPGSPPSRQHSRSSSMSSPIPTITTTSPPPPPRMAPMKAKSTPSLREASVLRSKGARFAPYSPTTSTRRGISSSPELEVRQPLRMRRRADNLTVRVHGSAYDSPPRLGASTPISSYVRRKTPTSPAFRESSTPALSPMGLTLPTLPSFFPSSPSSAGSAPLTPDTTDTEAMHTASGPPTKASLDTAEIAIHPRRVYPCGIRISTPPYSVDAAAEPHTRRRLPPG
ncbi:hypothetical protein BD626DRAFT_534396 [Schizophyllum amplum]|uniref:Uncharacterized protein n=1 Tax=Schizophyllum amplum TaxID=97359 RepID=A0A550CU21_9AGAR|nr:hypothetical protein BD626DRAFT_534396 [Auriculariopsis ampla]